MNVLLSAYACEPDKGSEPLVGWRWAEEVAALGLQVWVLTRSNNKAAIEARMQRGDAPPLRFIYFDFGPLMLRLKKLPGGLHAYYYLWQIAAFFVARKAHRSIGFGWVHHITFVTVRFPSFMGFLGIPFLLGPLGGGEFSPPQLRRRLGWRFWWVETLRDWTLRAHALDVFRRVGMNRATHVFATSEASKQCLPRAVQARTEVLLAIGGEGQRTPTQRQRNAGEPIRLLYAGQWRELKGLPLAFEAMAQARRQAGQTIHLTLVGSGPAEAQWRASVAQLGLLDSVEFKGWVARDELLGMYSDYDAFVFPSTHDSGGLVVLEAMSFGVPVFALDCGGPSVSVTEDSGCKIGVENQTYDEVVAALCAAMLRLNDAEQVARWRRGAFARAAALTWARQVRRAYEVVLKDN